MTSKCNYWLLSGFIFQFILDFSNQILLDFSVYSLGSQWHWKYNPRASEGSLDGWHGQVGYSSF